VSENDNVTAQALQKLPKSVCFVSLLLTGGICDRDVIVVCILTRIYTFFLELETMSFSRDFAVIFAIFTKVCHVYCHDFLLSLFICPIAIA